MEICRISLITAYLWVILIKPLPADEGYATYYTAASCQKEGTSGIMANGKPLNDKALTCATWDYAFGTMLRVTNEKNGKSVVCKVTDRGPAKRLYKKGVIIDLTLAAMKTVDVNLTGKIRVNVEVVK